MGNFILAVIMLSALIIFTGVNSFYICDVCDDIIELTDQSKFQEAVSLWEANSDYISFFVKDSDIDDVDLQAQRILNSQTPSNLDTESFKAAIQEIKNSEKSNLKNIF